MSLVNVNINEECIKAFVEEVRQKAHSFVVYKFTANFSEVVLEKKAEADAPLDDLLNCLPENDCRFASIDVNYDQGENGKRCKTILVLWCPMSAPVKSRMLYASGIKSFKAILGNYGAGSTLQCGNRAELSTEALIEKCKKFSAA